MRKRTPTTVANSDYSVPERQRIRHILTTVKWREGMSTRRLLHEMETQFPQHAGSVFKDQRQLTEFLDGSESNDAKIEFVVEYLTKNYPDLSRIITDDGETDLTGDVVSSMFGFYDQKSLYDRSLDVEDIKSLSGVYIILRPLSSDFRQLYT